MLSKKPFLTSEPKYTSEPTFKNGIFSALAVLRDLIFLYIDPDEEFDDKIENIA